MIDTRRAAEIAHPVFTINNWTYGGDVAPTVEVIQGVLNSLIRDAEQHPELSPGNPTFAATGRFQVRTDWFLDEEEPETHVLLELGNSFDAEELDDNI